MDQQQHERLQQAEAAEIACKFEAAQRSAAQQAEAERAAQHAQTARLAANDSRNSGRSSGVKGLWSYGSSVQTCAAAQRPCHMQIWRRLPFWKHWHQRCGTAWRRAASVWPVSACRPFLCISAYLTRRHLSVLLKFSTAHTSTVCQTHMGQHVSLHCRPLPSGKLTEIQQLYGTVRDNGG